MALRALAKLFPRQRGIISHFGKYANTHLLKITFEICGREPMFTRGLFVAQIRQTRSRASNEYRFGWRADAWPRSNYAARSTRTENVFARTAKSYLSAPPGPARVALRTCWPKRTAFAAFPRLKLPAGDKLRRLERAGRFDCKARKVRCSNHRVAGRGWDIFPVRAGVYRFFAEPFPKLIALVKQSCVGGICLKSLVIGGAGFRRSSGKC